MNVKSNIGSESGKNASLRYALLLYSRGEESWRSCQAGENPAEFSLATLHKVAVGESGRPRIEPGRPVSVAEISELFAHSDGTGSAKSEYLPESVLQYSPASLTWRRKSRRARLLFKTRCPALNAVSGMEFALPALLFQATPEQLRVWALRGDRRPVPGSRLFHAPFFNVFESGRVCLPPEVRGTLSDLMRIDKIPELERIFFDSYFTHSGGASTDKWHNAFYPAFARKCRKHPDCRFPAEELRAAGLTLAEVLK